jgi:hypothetical protein
MGLQKLSTENRSGEHDSAAILLQLNRMAMDRKRGLKDATSWEVSFNMKWTFGLTKKAIEAGWVGAFPQPHTGKPLAAFHSLRRCLSD